MADTGDDGHRRVAEDTTLVRAVGGPDVAGNRDLLDGRPREVGLLPVGATEQHGPHLPTGTDTIVATGFCRGSLGRHRGPGAAAAASAAASATGPSCPGTLSLTPERVGRPRRDAVTLGRQFAGSAACSASTATSATPRARWRADHLRPRTTRPAVRGPRLVDADACHQRGDPGGRRGRAREPGGDRADAGVGPEHVRVHRWPSPTTRTAPRAWSSGTRLRRCRGTG